MDWKTWLKGLISAIIGAAANGVTVLVVEPATFNLGEGFSKLLSVMAVSAIVAAAMYLKASPLPTGKISIMIIAGACLFFFAGGNVFADTYQSSGVKTASGVVWAKACTLRSVMVTGDGTNKCQIQCYDNASAGSGKGLHSPIVVPAGEYGPIGFVGRETRAVNGIYCTMTLADGDCSYDVEFW